MTLIAQIQPGFSTPTFLAILIPGLVCLGSAFASASIAESRARPLLQHFFLGLIAPVIWPLHIHSKLAAVVLDATPKEEFYVNRPRREDQQAAEFEVALDLDANYFRKIWKDASGAPRGPFIIETEDNVLQAIAIVEIQDKIVVLEIPGRQPGTTQRIRLPYEKIRGCLES